MRGIIATAAVAALLAFVPAVAAAPGDAPRDFSVLAKVTHLKKKGQLYFFRENLFADGRQFAGRARIVLDLRRRQARIEGRWRFRDGTILAKGRAGDSKRGTTAPISGGTGRYEGVRGTVYLNSEGGRRERETFDFR